MLDRGGGATAPRLAPHMTGEEIACYRRYLSRASSLLEYGVGGSTVLAAKLPVQNLVAIDSDPRWLAAVAADPAVAALVSAGRARLVHADLGPVGAWGKPAGRTGRVPSTAYARLPWQPGGPDPELVFIDGRYRIAEPAHPVAAEKQVPRGLAVRAQHRPGRHPRHIRAAGALQPAARADRAVVVPLRLPLECCDSDGRTVVILALVAGTQLATCSGARCWLDAGNESRHDQRDASRSTTVRSEYSLRSVPKWRAGGEQDASATEDTYVIVIPS
jgi:hypothetical protein